MRTGILTIGDEILTGFTVDTNSAWLAQELLKRGITVTQKASVGDRLEDIVEIIQTWDGHLDLVFTTGGLGPTHDDITKSAFCQYFKSDLRFDEDYWKSLSERFQSRGLEIPDSNRSQAEIPVKAEMLPNSVGTAPGLKFRSGATAFFVLPGVPREMQALMSEHILPGLGLGEAVPITTLRTTGIFESTLAERLAPLITEVSDVQIAYLPSYTGVDIRLRAAKSVGAIGQQAVLSVAERMESELGILIYGRNEETLEAVVGRLLTRRGESLAVAESCSGGLTTTRITDIPGSSTYFRGGIVAYSNESKIKQLGVSSDLIKSHGAVSEPVAREMAVGVRKAFESSWGIATTGISGPSGGTPRKPIGLVFIAVAGPERTLVRELHLIPLRQPHRAATAQAVLNLLRLEIMRYGT